MWPWPRGKYQTSPGPKSLVSEVPSGAMTVVRTRPVTTNAHSAALACQCSSRMPPGLRRIDTPAMPVEMGSCRTVACRAEPPSVTWPGSLSSSAKRKFGMSSCCSGRSAPAAAAPTAAAAAALNNFLRLIPAISVSSRR